MKKYLLLFALGLVWFGCDADAYTPEEAGLEWTYPKDYDQGVIGFIIYRWSGDSLSYDMASGEDRVLNWNIGNMDSIAFVPYDYATADTLLEFRPFLIDNAYTRAGAAAVDSLGNRSAMALSQFVAYWDFYGPEQPRNARLKK